MCVGGAVPGAGVEGSVMAQLWDDDKIRALIQVSSDAYGTDSTLDNAMWQMRDDYERALSEQAALAAQAARTIEAQAARIADCEQEYEIETSLRDALHDEVGELRQRIAELEGSLKKVEWW